MSQADLQYLTVDEYVKKRILAHWRLRQGVVSSKPLWVSQQDPVSKSKKKKNHYDQQNTKQPAKSDICCAVKTGVWYKQSIHCNWNPELSEGRISLASGPPSMVVAGHTDFSKWRNKCAISFILININSNAGAKSGCLGKLNLRRLHLSSDYSILDLLTIRKKSWGLGSLVAKIQLLWCWWKSGEWRGDDAEERAMKGGFSGKREVMMEHRTQRGFS